MRARDQSLRFDQALNPLFGWSGLVGNLEVIDTDRDHIGHLKPPHVKELGPKLQGLLRTQTSD